MITWQLVAVLVVLAVALVAFVWEWAAPELVAMSAFCALFCCGALSVDDAFSVFSNHAPITIAALFMLTGALEKTGAIETLGRVLSERLGGGLRGTLLGVTIVAGAVSAFMNNTPVVAIFLPAMLGLARSRNLAVSKLLIPLSYAAVAGGCCTLIGTSTNIVVSGLLDEHGQRPIGMYELSAIGVPFLIIAVVYLVIFSPRILPDRATVTSVLGPEDRTNYLAQVLVRKGSPMAGRLLVETELARAGADFRILEVRRAGQRLRTPLDRIVVQPYDRILISASARRMVQLPQVRGLALGTETETELGVESLSTVEGSIVEGVVAPHSELVGKTIREVNFRQTYGMVILAIHRQGRNLSARFQDVKLQFGDTLLMLGPVATFTELQGRGDFMLLEDKLPLAYRRAKAPLAWLALIAVVTLASFGVPVVAATTVACLAVLLTRCLEPREAYRMIDWSVIFLLYGMLGVGLALERSGGVDFLAGGAVDWLSAHLPPAWVPHVALFLCYGVSMVLTEVLSNTATAVIMVPLAIGSAAGLGLDPRPFAIAVTLASSLAFATPIGYQTNTMVFGVGGYKFVDFVRAGLPLNLAYWFLSTWWIPMLWPFR